MSKKKKPSPKPKTKKVAKKAPGGRETKGHSGHGHESGGESWAPEPSGFVLGGVRVRTFATRCPDTPNEYCSENHAWAITDPNNVLEWIAEMERTIDGCCGSAIAGGTTAAPTQSCSGWPAAWQELRGFALRIRPRLEDAEEAFSECSGAKIKAPIPTPKAGPLSGSDADERRKQACRRARAYFKRFEKWANEMRDEINDHCEDHHPTHLSPPPDPPF